MIIEKYCSMCYYRITQSPHCIHDNDNNAMHVNMWFDFFSGLV